MLAEAREAGMDAASIAALTEDLREDGEQDGVIAFNADVVRAFLAVRTQWRTGTIPKGFGSASVMIGLDYGAVLAALDRLGFDVPRDLFIGLQTMEFAAMAAFNKVALN